MHWRRMENFSWTFPVSWTSARVQFSNLHWVSLRYDLYRTYIFYIILYCLRNQLSALNWAGCGNPPLLINGAYKAESEPNQEHYIHDTITYFCISGYYLNAPAGAKSTCLAGNRWSLNESASNFPICEPGEPLIIIIPLQMLIIC